MVKMTRPEAQCILSDIENDQKQPEEQKRFIRENRDQSTIYYDKRDALFHKFTFAHCEDTKEKTSAMIWQLKKERVNELAVLSYLPFLGMHGPDMAKGRFFEKSLNYPVHLIYDDEPDVGIAAAALVTTSKVKGYTLDEINSNNEIDSDVKRRWNDLINYTVMVDGVTLYDFDRSNPENTLFDIETEYVNQVDFGSADIVNPSVDDTSWLVKQWKEDIYSLRDDAKASRTVVKDMLMEKSQIITANKKHFPRPTYKAFLSRIKHSLVFVDQSPLFYDNGPV